MITLLTVSTSLLGAQTGDLSRIPVLMHYMPWFEAPDGTANSSWGYHWKMANADPNSIDESGKRQIASHYYPLIGPYSSNDPAVIEYHLLLMKHAGIDGLVIDWYGVKGGNSDIQMLTRNTDVVIQIAEELGMPFCLMIEDNFWRDTVDASESFGYAAEHYLNHENHLRGRDNRPYLPVFGPSQITDSSIWDGLKDFENPPLLITLLGKQQEAAINADGSFSWVYADHLEPLQGFYETPKSPGEIKWGSAYARFHDHYQEGGIKSSLFHLKDSAGQCLEKTLRLAAQYSEQLDAIQLVTFNDFGEGTALEPTQEFGFRDLSLIAKYTLNNSDTSVYKLIYRNYLTTRQNEFTFNQKSRYNRIVKLLSDFRVRKARKLLIKTEREMSNLHFP